MQTHSITRPALKRKTKETPRVSVWIRPDGAGTWGCLCCDANGGWQEACWTSFGEAFAKGLAIAADPRHRAYGSRVRVEQRGR